MTPEKWELVVGKGYGDIKTVGADKLVGMGTSRINQSAFNTSGKLILHPVRLPESDRSKDIVFFKATPLPESINYDGTDTQAMSVSFDAFVDDTKDSRINVWAMGDWRKALR